MKQYINRQEQDDLVFLTMLISKTADIIEREQTREKPLMDKQVITWAKRSNSLLLNQVIKPIVRNLSPEAKEKYLRSAKNNRVQCVPTETLEYYIKKARQERREEECIVKMDVLEDLAEMALYACNPCKWDNDNDRLKCKGRAAMIALDIPYYDNNATICPYLISKKE